MVVDMPVLEVYKEVFPRRLPGCCGSLRVGMAAQLDHAAVQDVEEQK